METARRSPYSTGASRLTLKRRRRHAVLTSHGISSAARRARANAEALAAPHSGSDGTLPTAADNPHICSGKSLISGLPAVPLPSSGRTHLAVWLTVGDARLPPFLT
jgi:hypothetical protein